MSDNDSSSRDEMPTPTFGWHETRSNQLAWVTGRDVTGYSVGVRCGEGMNSGLSLWSKDIHPCAPAHDDRRLDWFRDNLNHFPPEFQPDIPTRQLRANDKVQVVGGVNSSIATVVAVSGDVAVINSPDRPSEFRSVATDLLHFLRHDADGGWG